MGEDAQDGREKGEAVDDAEKQLEDHYRVDQLGEEALRNDGVLFDELGEVVEAGGYEGTNSRQPTGAGKASKGKLISERGTYLSPVS